MSDFDTLLHSTNTVEYRRRPRRHDTICLNGRSEFERCKPLRVNV